MWTRHKNAEHDLYLEGVRKALDIPPTPGFHGGNTTHVSNNGLGWKTLLAVGALTLGGIAGGTWFLQNNQREIIKEKPVEKLIEKKTKEDFRLGPLEVVPPK